MESMNYRKHDLICSAGEVDDHLYKIIKGKLLVCKLNEAGDEVVPLAYLSAGSYMGEFSFFDNAPRSAYIICAEDSELCQFDQKQRQNLPPWLLQVFNDLIYKIRLCDSLLADHGVRKGSKSLKALNIDEQRQYLQIITG